MTIQHLFTDLDGTLLLDNGKLSERTIKTVRQLKIPLTLVSARTPAAMREIIETLELKSPQVAFNGGLIFQEQEVLKAEPLVFSEAKALIFSVKKQFPELNISLYTLENWHIERMDTDILQEMEYTPQLPILTDFTEFLKTEQPLFKILIIIPDEEQLNQLQVKLAKAFPTTNPQKTWVSFLEITSKKAQKSTGIQHIAKCEHLKKTELAAFGDNYNDLPMFDVVGLPIAMANAPEAVKKSAKMVTKTNEEDGVADGIEKYLADRLVSE